MRCIYCCKLSDWVNFRRGQNHYMLYAFIFLNGFFALMTFKKKIYINSWSCGKWYSMLSGYFSMEANNTQNQ